MRSQSDTNAVNTNKMIKTTIVLCWSWSRFGQVTRRSSPRTLRTNSAAPASLPFCCVAPFPALRLLAIISSPDLVIKSRAGGTRTPDLRFWRPLLYQLSYCPLPTWSPGAPYAAGTTGNTFSTGYGLACCAGSYGCGSSGAYTPHMPALPIVAQDPPNHRGETNHPAPVTKSCPTRLSLLRRQHLQSCPPRGWRSSTPRPWRSERSAPRSSPCCLPASPSLPPPPTLSPPSRPSS